MYACRICQPVMCMNDIEILLTSNNSCNNRVIINLLMQIVRIATTELHASQVIYIHIVKVGIYMVAQTEIQLRIHNITYPALNIIIIDITPCDWNIIHCYYVHKATILIPPWFRETECYVHVALSS